MLNESSGNQETGRGAMNLAHLIGDFLGVCCIRVLFIVTTMVIYNGKLKGVYFGVLTAILKL